MFSLSDLKNTRFYQEVFTEGRVEGRVEGELETRQAVMLKMIQRGLASVEIAAILDLPLAEVEAARAGRSQSSQD
jgi:predicted transposase YdaD